MKIYIAQDINEKTDYAVFTSKKECDKWIRENTEDSISAAAKFEAGNRNFSSLSAYTDGREFEVDVIDFKLNKQSVLHAVDKIIDVVL